MSITRSAARTVLIAAAFVLSFATLSSGAERLSALPKAERGAWGAVGVVASKGPDGPVACSGTLVAADLVVTAAHCVAHDTGLMEGIQFIAGLDGTRRIATSSAVEVLRFPVWDHAKGHNRIRLDLAVLRLGRLIPADKQKPIDLLPPEQSLPAAGALLGYQKSRGNSLYGRFGCTLERSRALGVLTSDCLATKGNSGGPVLVKDGDDWLLAAVIVAIDEDQGTTFLVEANGWLFAQVKAAENRETARAAKPSDARP